MSSEESSRYVRIVDLYVPRSLKQACEEWAARDGHDADDILRSVINQGLLRYCERSPKMVPLLKDAVNDLHAMGARSHWTEEVYVLTMDEESHKHTWPDDTLQ
jgi:hypothetical protein